MIQTNLKTLLNIITGDPLMNKFTLPLAMIVLSVALISIPTAFADGSDDEPSFVLTIVCSVYGESTDDLVELIFGLDASDCSIQTEVGDATHDEPDRVILSRDSSLPGCVENDDCFAPSTVTVSPGETVVWVNEDITDHTVTSNEPHPDGILDEWISPGDAYAFTFETAGEYPYHCVIHPWAMGVVVVESDDDDRPMEVMREIVEQYSVRSDAILKYIDESAGEIYDDVAVFALDRESLDVVAHSENPVFIGVNARTVLDGASIPIDALIDLLDTQTDGVWLSYPVPDPATGTLLFYERGWFQASGDYYFGIRFSISDATFSQNVVEELVRIHKLDPDKTIDFVNSIGTTDTSYPFILSPTDYTVLAHGADPTRVGEISVSLTDSDKPAEVIIDELQNNEGTWVEYVFSNPSTGMDQNKRSWLVLHDDLIFGSGYYQDDSTSP